MADEDSGAPGEAGVVASVLRHWAPYVGFAATIFVASAAAGVALEAGGPSPFVPESAGADAGSDAPAIFLGLLSTAALMVLGGVFVGLPTVALLAQQGYEFGGAFATLVGETGLEEALALAGPPALVGGLALWLAGAIPLRGLHAGARMITDRDLSTTTERIVAESLLLGALSLAGLGVAAVLASP